MDMRPRNTAATVKYLQIKIEGWYGEFMQVIDVSVPTDLTASSMQIKIISLCSHYVPAVTGIAGSHHVLCVEHLLGELGHGERSVLLATA